MLKGVIFLYFHQKIKWNAKCTYSRGLGNPLLRERARMSSPQRVRTRELTPTCDPHPPFLFAAVRPLPTTALPHTERASHERDRNENDCGHRKYCCDRGGVGDFRGFRTWTGTPVPNVCAQSPPAFLIRHRFRSEAQ